MKTYYKGYIINEDFWIYRFGQLISVVNNLHEAKEFIDNLNK